MNFAFFTNSYIEGLTYNDIQKCSLEGVIIVRCGPMGGVLIRRERKRIGNIFFLPYEDTNQRKGPHKQIYYWALS
jgi:hypothetical protein